ncbi:MAG TPA: serine/threonine-protein kinase [Mycobacterium sp.]|nr:serine/threonine-protein kinase [Mycobacterium sp.]
MPLADGQLFAGYTILRRLGSGAMGEVYLAQHPRLPRRDALKVLPAEFTSDNEYRKRFLREADIAATLMHPHIVGVHDRGEFDGQLWLSMDYINGTDVARLQQERFPQGMPPDDVVWIVTAVADALDYAHEHQLLHRDVKPANILLTQPGSRRGRVFLADFGIARRIDDASGLTGTNMTVGTVAYAAPEQLMGQPLDGRADQYALAATTFHLLTGTTLFQHPNQAAVISQHLTAPPPAIADRRPELSELDPVLSKALAKSRDDRYNSCLDFAEALATQIGAIARHLDADRATMAALPRSAHRRLTVKSSLRPVISLPVMLVLLLIGVVAAAAFILIARDRNQPVAQPRAQTPSSAPRGTAPPIPVVLIGADCATLGAAGVSATGAPAYCARLATTGATMWSLYKSQIPVPSETPGPTDQVYPPGVEDQVRVCVDETGQTRVKCHDEIGQGAPSGRP